MNGAEQKSHKTALATLEHAQCEFAEAMVDRMDALAARLEAADTRLNEERTHRLQMATEQRLYVDRADRDYYEAFTAFRGRTLWLRLRWLITGR